MRNSLLSFLFVGLAACSVEAPDSVGTGEDRGALGKADVVGSCIHKGTELCGGKGKGNCWCDDACVDFGDCCDDADDVCGLEPPPPEGEPCGGIAGLACDEGEFCFYTPEQMCGAADHLGECVTQPDACIQLFDPVCGCDGQTYSNACHASAAGVSVGHEGECEDSAECQPVLCALFCENGFATDEDGCPICSCVDEIDTCGPIEQDFEAAVADIRVCETDDECGQVLAGTSCGCTRNWVARIDADLSDYEEIRTKLEANECMVPGTISTCDCPAADGFACEAGVCTWNYLEG
jgi:hypothetical protein